MISYTLARKMLAGVCQACTTMALFFAFALTAVGEVPGAMACLLLTAAGCVITAMVAP